MRRGLLVDVAAGGSARPTRAGRERKPPVTSEILDRQPPRNLEAERGVLGSILLLPDVCDDVALVFAADDFYDDANRKLYQCMLDMHSGGQRIDTTLLVERLEAAATSS